MEPRNLARAKALYTAKQNTIHEIMQMTGFKSRTTFYKYVVHPEGETSPLPTDRQIPIRNSLEAWYEDVSG